MGNTEGIHRRDQVIAELKKELDVHIQRQKVDAERIERLQTDHNNACRTIKDLLNKRDLADAKNEGCLQDDSRPFSASREPTDCK